MTPSALKTDRYQLTMLAAYFHRGMAGRRATCELFTRRLPAQRAFWLFAGLERAVRRLRELRFGEDEIRYLASQPGLRSVMTPDLIAYLRDFRFRGDLHAMPEGTVFFPQEPVIRVEATLPEAQLVETLLLSIVNHDVRVASKAARVKIACGDASVMEFGTRRTHEEAAPDAARAAYIAGFVGTSNEAAGMRDGIPVFGTVAHMWTMAHAAADDDGEEAAFREWAAVYPEGSVFLVDTYDTPRGVDRAIACAGKVVKGVRLDSGDLAELSKVARAKLDAAGLGRAQVVASGDLNEYKVRALLERGARIDGYGVGTDVVLSLDAPAVGAVYKLVAIEAETGETLPVAKRSAGKATWPGAKQVWRRRGGDGRFAADEIALADEPAAARLEEGAEPLLVPVLRGGELVAPLPSLDDARERARRQLAGLPERLREIPAREEAVVTCEHPVVPSEALRALLEPLQGVRGAQPPENEDRKEA